MDNKFRVMQLLRLYHVVQSWPIFAHAIVLIKVRTLLSSPHLLAWRRRLYFLVLVCEQGDTCLIFYTENQYESTVVEMMCMSVCIQVLVCYMCCYDSTCRIQLSVHLSIHILFLMLSFRHLGLERWRLISQCLVKSQLEEYLSTIPSGSFRSSVIRIVSCSSPSPAVLLANENWLRKNRFFLEMSQVRAVNARLFVFCIIRMQNTDTEREPFCTRKRR